MTPTNKARIEELSKRKQIYDGFSMSLVPAKIDGIKEGDANARKDILERLREIDFTKSNVVIELNRVLEELEDEK